VPREAGKVDDEAPIFSCRFTNAPPSPIASKLRLRQHHFNQAAAIRTRAVSRSTRWPARRTRHERRAFSLADLREEAGNSADTQVPSGEQRLRIARQVPNVDRGLKQARFAVSGSGCLHFGRVRVPLEFQRVSRINLPAWRAKLAGAIVDGIDDYKLRRERRPRPSPNIARAP
jgi:hypothetical protein